MDCAVDLARHSDCVGAISVLISDSADCPGASLQQCADHRSTGIRVL